MGGSLAVYEKFVPRLWESLELYCNSNSQAEKDFFSLYCALSSKEDQHTGAFLPALIPNVYINWHSSKDERPKREIPYIVDFIFKSPLFGTNDLIIVEVDGFSHYANYNLNSKTQIAAEEIYAKHLKKDRWLRKQGFKVFRIGNFEIKEIMQSPEKEQLSNFYHFFKEVFGEIVYIEEYENYDHIFW